ncbi:MAG: hypothetical protein J6A89_03430 [Clostridia bacterium]|nr:hypothetical protein [Clostridia bacterium]
MLKKLIIIENNIDYQFDNLTELIKNLIDENYYELKEQEKKQKLKMLATANCIGNDLKVVEECTQILDKEIIIKDEITYLLSLVLNNRFILLEEKDANILTKNLDKAKIENNYIIVNTFAKELLIKYLEEK